MLLAIAGCGGAPDRDATIALGDESRLATGISCALSGAAVQARQCAVDRETTRNGLMLTLRHPDGGFRRVLVVQDGRGVVAADGAEPALVRPVADNAIDVAIAGDVYRLPATVKGQSAS